MTHAITTPNPVSRRHLLHLASLAAAPVGLLGWPHRALAEVGDQPDWRFCNKCNAMFYNGAAEKGRCPAGGAHAPQGFLFSLHYDSNKAGEQRIQYAWRYCGKCRSLFFDGFPQKGRCAADGGGHVAQGLMFGLDHQPPTGKHQKDWRFCNKCNSLFFDGFANKGRCPAGGAHVAQGFNFNILYREAYTDPGKAISDVLQTLVEANRPEFERRIKAELGRGDMIRKGVTLRDINFRMGTVDFKSTRNQFNYRINNNYLYFKSTTPTVFGSYADPAFEVHFDSSLSGAIILPPGGVKPRVDRVIASVPRITIKPRNVTGGVVTTVVAFFQATAAGGRMIQEAHDKHLNVNLTPRINDYLARF